MVANFCACVCGQLVADRLSVQGWSNMSRWNMVLVRPVWSAHARQVLIDGEDGRFIPCA